MIKILYSIFFLFIVLTILDVLFSIWRNYRRTTNYSEALYTSKKIGKDLLVIGDPNAGFWNKHIQNAYGCGDICLDLMGCGSCPTQIKGDLLENLKKIPDNQYVIFESCVLEYIDADLLPDIYKEIQRVSNGNYYEVRISPNIFTTNLDFIQYG